MAMLEISVRDFVFSPDARVLVTAEGDFSLRIRELATRQERYRFQSPDKKPRY